jgi:hypothetical protein
MFRLVSEFVLAMVSADEQQHGAKIVRLECIDGTVVATLQATLPSLVSLKVQLAF